MILLSVDTSSHKLNLRWVAKQTHKFPRKYTQVTKKNQGYELHTYPVFQWLIACYKKKWTSLNLR